MKHIAVIGSGTMGSGIAHVFVQHQYQVSLVDISKEALDKAMQVIERNLSRQVGKEIISEDIKQKALANITCFQDVKSGVQSADLVVEAATETLSLKQSIFKEMDIHAPEHATLATNTSSISITEIASVTQRPDRVIGMHFMNPVPVMKLVEVIKGYSTSDKTMDAIIKLTEKLNKTPIPVSDYPGFIANRILMPMINEAIYSLYEGVAGVSEIDSVMMLGMSHPMGPLRLADFIGLDVCLYILKVLQDGFGNPKYAPCPLLVNMVRAGHLGSKTGIGFYQYQPNSKEFSVAPRFVK